MSKSMLDIQVDRILQEMEKEAIGQFDPDSPDYIGDKFNQYETEGLTSPVPSIEEFKESIKHFRKDVRNSLKAGWSISDIKSFMRLTEEFNPYLSERIALQRMSKINFRNKISFGLTTH